MPDRWTEKQYEAITARGDLLVSAAAGAGKTAVLTERIARLIAEGADVESLLVVTFTKAAAAEMKSRIAQRLQALSQEASERGDDETAVRLASSAAACERANISTIHSFCASVLRRCYHEAGIDPGFAVSDGAQAELLAMQAVDAVLEEAFAANEREPDAGFKALVTAVGDDEKLARLILSLYDYAMAKPEPEEWLDRAVSIYTDDFMGSAGLITGGLMALARRELQVHMDKAALLRTDLGTEYPKTAAVMDSDRSKLLELILLNDYDAMHEALSHLVFDTLSWPRSVDEEFKKPYKDYRKSMKEHVKKLEKLFAFPLEEEARFARMLAGPIECLRRLVLAFRDEFTKLKADAGIIDFTDMEQLTLRVLRSPGAAEEYRARFAHVFVDEYQDINPAQEAILAAVSRDNRFMVGDVKQSIYRFRQAEPNIFLEKYNTYNGENGRLRIDLNCNFRSDTAILDAANLLFSQLMRGEDAGEITYDDNAALRSGRENAPAGSVELVLIERSAEQDEDADETEEDESADAAEAAYAARRILDMMANYRIPEGEGSRPCRWSDFTVLLRSARDASRHWVSTLAAAGIPCVSDAGGGFFDAVEIRVFMDLLRVIDNRRQDIPLLAVMRSHICSFTEEELIHVKADYEGGDILDRIVAAARDVRQPGWSIKCADLLARLERWRRLSRLMGIGEFMGLLLDETRFEVDCAALPGGEARAANLRALWENARKLSAGGVYGLHGFIDYMDRAKEAGAIDAPQTPFTDAVRIMTIHRSKGLEFPVVFLGGVAKRFNRTMGAGVGVFDPELGIGLCSVYGDRKAKCLLQRAIVAREELRMNAEEMRVLYVAQTRARNALIMLGAVKDTEAFAEKHMRPLDPLRIMHANTYAEWLLGAYFPHGCGENGEVRLPCGGSVMFASVPRPGAFERGGMDEEGFFEWSLNAAEADHSSLDALFEAGYEKGADTALPSKLSVTGLTMHFAELTERPRFMQEDRPMTAADVGTLTHRLLQLITLREHTSESVDEELRSLVRRGMFTEREAGYVRTAAVLGFLGSPLGKRMLASPRVEREKEFNIMTPASELIGADSDEPIMLQGVIDCCFIEDGEWVLIDHKTTRVDANRTARTAAEQYRRQLELYANALRMLTGIPVKQKYVYMLSADEAVELR